MSNANLIDRYLPEYDFRSRHNRRVKTNRQTIYPVIRHLDFRGSAITRWLFKLRGLSFSALTMDGILTSDLFSIIQESPDDEFVIGALIRLPGKPMAFNDGRQYNEFQQDNSLKIAWNFRLNSFGENLTEVSTETRVKCIGKQAKTAFAIYWFFIKPFSGWIRREMLRLIKKQSEKTN